MAERLHIVTGKVDGTTYLVLSSDGSLKVASFNYSQPDKFIVMMRKRRQSCRVPAQVFVPSPWTKWLEEKSQNF